ncbi:radical SAM family heme chaperone HemW, partial [Streptococcus pyogenes]
IQHYLKSIREKGHSRLHEEMLSKKEQMEEEMFLGLRKKSGVSIAKFEEKFQLSFQERYGQIVEQMVQDGLLQVESDQVRMTKQGL